MEAQIAVLHDGVNREVPGGAGGRLKGVDPLEVSDTHTPIGVALQPPPKELIAPAQPKFYAAGPRRGLMGRRHRKSDFTFVQMWPRQVMQLRAEGSRWRLATKGLACLERPGVYVLYRDDEPYYVGKAVRLHKRLHDHANKMGSKYYGMWNYFSAYAFNPNTKNLQERIDEMEGILIAMVPRANNGSRPRWRKERIPKALRKQLKEALGHGGMTIAAKAGSFR